MRLYYIPTEHIIKIDMSCVQCTIPSVRSTNYVFYVHSHVMECVWCVCDSMEHDFMLYANIIVVINNSLIYYRQKYCTCSDIELKVTRVKYLKKENQ